MRGRVMSLHAISTRGMGPLSGFQLGATASFLGVQSAVALGGLVCIVVASLVAWRVRAVRNFTGDDQDANPDEGVVPARSATITSGRPWGWNAAREADS